MTQIKPLRVALVGVGGYGKFHLGFITTLEREGLLDLVATADPMLDRASQVAKNLEVRGVRHYDTDAEIKEREGDNLDLIVISSPISAHEEMIRRWLDSRAWIYLEKPPVPTIQQLRSLVSADAGRRVRVGFQLIWLESLRTLKRWIVKGDLGDVQRISAIAAWPRNHAYYSRSDWAGKLLHQGRATFDGVATNALSHAVHNLMFLGGSRSLDAFGMPESLVGEFYRANDIESYDLATIHGKFSNGASFDIGLSHCASEVLDTTIRVEGTRGTASLGAGGQHLIDRMGKVEAWDMHSASHAASLRIYRELISQMQKNDPMNATPSTLEDCLPYSIATCGGLLSSGRIVDIPTAAIHTYRGGGSMGSAVTGLNEALEILGKEGRSLKDQAVPWAIAGSPVETRTFTSLNLEQFANQRSGAINELEPQALETGFP